MADMVSVDEVAEAMYKSIEEATKFKKKLKPMDLRKGAIALFGEDRCDKKICKLAIKQIVDSGRCVYTYFGGSFIELPHKEGAAN
jgi:hypothetical protein